MKQTNKLFIDAKNLLSRSYKAMYDFITKSDAIVDKALLGLLSAFFFLGLGYLFYFIFFDFAEQINKLFGAMNWMIQEVLF